MKEQWNERYAAAEYIYGIHPNVWFAEKLSQIKPGNLLLPAEGEGRNAVFAAKQGWDVAAFDQSEEGKLKALKLASENGVTIQYIIDDLESYIPGTAQFDTIALVFVHMPAALRQKVHGKLLEYLKPGGYLILEAFTKRQLQNTSGGPRTASLLYDPADISADFNALNLIEFEETTTALDEGPLHKGEACVVRLFAQKPENDQETV